MSLQRFIKDFDMRYVFCEECNIEEDSPTCIWYQKNCELYSFVLEFIEVGLKLFTYDEIDRKLMEGYIKEVSRKIYYMNPYGLDETIKNISNITVEFIIKEDNITLQEKAGLRRSFDLLKVELIGIDD